VGGAKVKSLIVFPPEELVALSGAKVVATSCVSVLDEYFRAHPNISAAVEGRLTYRAS
jgi:hypothetical protein